MLSLHLWPNDIAAIIIDHNQLIMNWVKPSANKKFQAFELKAHRVIPLHAAEGQPHLFNLTTIKKHILEFLTTHKIKHAQVAMGLSAPGIIEQLVTSPTAAPQRHDFTFLPTGCPLWDYVYLYPHDNGTFTFYVCGIQQQQLLQYKLLAISANLNLKTLIPSRLALLHLYHAVQGSVFRHSQLGVAMQQNNNNIEQLCTTETVHRLLSINAHVSINFTEQAPHLRTTLGLCLSNRLYESNV